MFCSLFTALTYTGLKYSLGPKFETLSLENSWLKELKRLNNFNQIPNKNYSKVFPFDYSFVYWILSMQKNKYFAVKFCFKKKEVNKNF